MKEVITAALTNVLIAVLSVGSAYAVMLLNKAKKKLEAETEKIKEDRLRDRTKSAIDSLHLIAAKTITKIEQTTAEKLRQDVKDGVADKTELYDLADQAFDEIILTLKPEYKKLLETELGNFQEYVATLIEEKVFEIKRYGICSTV